MTALLGNDVVDLTSPHARGKSGHARFVTKVLTADERKALDSSPHPDLDLWRYWAAKESAYKALSREEPGLSSVPGRYGVVWQKSSYDHVLTGRVYTPSGPIPVVSWWDGDRVCCLCHRFTFPASLGFGVTGLPPGSITDYTRTTDEQSRLVRQRAIQSLSSFLDCPPHAIDIRKPLGYQGASGPPEIYVNESKADILLSLSHDGRFVFFAWSMAGPVIKL